MLKIERTVTHNCKYYLHWYTHQQRPTFAHANDTRAVEMQSILKRIAKTHDVQVWLVLVDANFVYLLVSIPPKKSITSVVKTLKGQSARLFFEAFPELKDVDGRLWDGAYLVQTTGQIDTKTLKDFGARVSRKAGSHENDSDA